MTNREIIIFWRGKTRLGKAVWIHPPLWRVATYQLLRGGVASVVALIVLMLGFSYGPVMQQEWHYYWGQTEMGASLKPGFDDYLITSQVEKVVAVQAEAEEWGVQSHFSLVVPSIEAAANVVANVPAGDESAYMEALSKGVAHAQGTYFPGQGKTIYLFAHSTDSPLNLSRFNAVFYSLRHVVMGDDVYMFFADKKYHYVVDSTEIVAADDVSWLTKDFGKEKLVLQTCYPPGTTWKRLIVTADLVE